MGHMPIRVPRTSISPRLFTPNTRFIRPMSTSTNASGLLPAESKALRERSPTPQEEKIAQALKEMYSCNPTATTFFIYEDKAVFHDPIGYAEGMSSIRAQFVGLAKIFEKAEIPKF